MSITPEQIEAVAKMRLVIQSAVEDDARAWELTDTELAVIAEAAISAMRPFIRAEVLEEAAKRVAELPMIVGIPGLPYERHRNSFEYAAAIRALKEKP